MNRDTENASSLQGVVVLDFSRVLAGPLATMTLGDLGAEVIKIERPGSGDDTRAWGPPYSSRRESSYYLAANRNKQSVVIDLKTESGRARARSLVKRADVLVENFKPGTMSSFGLGYEQLADENPGLVYARITGFGSGAGADIPGYDLLVQAMSGLMSITGQRDGPPMKVGVAVVDVLAGLYTTIGVLAALNERHQSGRGQFLEVSLLASALSGLVNQASSFLTAGVVPTRLGMFHPSIAPYEPFETTTGLLIVAVGNDSQFARLCDALGLTGLATDERWKTNEVRIQNRQELHEIIQAKLASESRDTWTSRLRAARVPVGPVNTIEEAFSLAEQLELDPIAITYRPDGQEVATVSNPIRLERTPVVYRYAPPRLGEEGPWLDNSSSQNPTSDSS